MHLNQRLTYSVVLSGLGVLFGLAGCETPPKEQAGPGQVPQLATAETPRINAATYFAHGQLLERRGEYERAAEQYRRALELTPDLVAARSRLGVTLNKLGDHRAASNAYRTALESDPQAAYLLNNLGFSLYLEEKFDEAEPVLARAVELQPEFRRAWMNYGLVLARLGKDAEALSAFETASNRADALYNLGVIQAEAARYVEAAASFEAALAEQPDLEAARDQLRYVARLAADAAGGLAAASSDQVVPAARLDDEPPAAMDGLADVPTTTDLGAGATTTIAASATTTVTSSERAVVPDGTVDPALASATREPGAAGDSTAGSQGVSSVTPDPVSVTASEAIEDLPSTVVTNFDSPAAPAQPAAPTPTPARTLTRLPTPPLFDDVPPFPGEQVTR